MKKILIALMIVLMMNSSALFAQNHFIYIQSESRKSFTVTVSDKQFNSTATGYVIIPRLKPGTHEIWVNFKDSQVPQLKFTTIIDRKDVGYNLRDISNSSFAMVDMQSFSVLTANPVESYVKSDKPAVSNVATDIDKSTANKSITIEKSIENKVATPAVTKSGKPVTSTTTQLRKGVNKVSEEMGENSISLLFIDIVGKSADTIDVVIPVIKKELIKSSYYRSEGDKSLFKWASSYETIDDFQNGYNAKCVHLLTKEDFARLRRKMSAESSEDKMIEEAVKSSKSKCFTTGDVKKLSTLFIKEQGKYKFFDAVFSSVYDYIDYPELEKELTDESIINKFRSMLNR